MSTVLATVLYSQRILLDTVLMHMHNLAKHTDHLATKKIDWFCKPKECVGKIGTSAEVNLLSWLLKNID